MLSKSERRSSILSAEQYENNSAQSPPCSKNALPLDTSASCFLNFSICQQQ